MNRFALAVAVAGAFSVAVQRVAMGVVAPSLRTDLGLSAAQLGWLFSTFTVAILGGYVLMTVVTVALGSRRTMAIVLAGSAAATLGIASATSFGSVVVAYDALGVFSAGVIPVSLQFFREASPRFRGTLIAAVVLTPALAGWLAPLAGAAAIGLWGWRSVMAGAAVPGVVFALLWMTARVRRFDSADGWTQGFESPATWALAIGLGLAYPAWSVLGAVVPIYLRDRDPSGTTMLTLYTGARVLAGSASALAAGLVWDLTRRHRAAVVVVYGVLLLAIAMLSVPASAGALIVITAVVALGYQGWTVWLYANVADGLPPAAVAVGAAIGLVLTIPATLVMPMVTGYAVAGDSATALFVTVGALPVLATLPVSLLIRRGATVVEQGGRDSDLIGDDATTGPPRGVPVPIVSPAFFVGSIAGGLLLGTTCIAAGVFAAAAGASVPTAMAVIAVGFALDVYAEVVFLLLLYKAWSSVQDGGARTTPGKAVGLLFIPVFNWYWIFRALPGFADEYNGRIGRANVQLTPLKKGALMSLAVLTVMSIVPVLGWIAGLVALVVECVAAAQLCTAINNLSASPQGGLKDAAVTYIA